VEFYGIGKLLHKEYAPAADLEKVFRSGGVRDALRVKSTTFIRHSDSEAVFSFPELYPHCFGFIFAIAMNDSVIDSFGKADQYIAVHIGAKFIALDDLLNEGLYKGNIPWV